MPVVKINAIEVPAEAGPELEKRFAHRAHAVENSPGFLGFSNMVGGSEVADNIFENVNSDAEEAPPNPNHNAYSGSSDGGTGSFTGYAVQTSGTRVGFPN